jgi:diguanylate cyclase (GGDEF)-like protein/putative nucleotidyltransferase with HDIG domain
MRPADQDGADAMPGSDNEREIASLRNRLARAEQHMAQTLMRATRLAQVISVLGNEKDLETTVERVAIEVGELFFADIALLILASDTGLRIAGHWGVAVSDLPTEPFRLPAVERLTRLTSVRIGPAEDIPLPEWIAAYSPRHVAWARLLVGDKSLGLMLLARRGEEPFEESETTELRAVAYRIALAIENGLLHQRMKDQLAQLHRLQQLTAALAGTLELNAVGRLVADTLVSEASVSASVVLIDRSGELVVLSSAGSAGELGIAGAAGRAVVLDDRWESFPLEVAGRMVGVVAVTAAPLNGSEPHQLLLHLVSLGALSLDKALLYEQSREQARHDSLTGLLGHRVFHEALGSHIAAGIPFGVLLFDIDDFKEINDLHGHQTGDHALRLVSDALRRGTRAGDTVFRIGGEEFCALLPGLGERDAFGVAEAVRHRVAAMVSTLPNPVTVSVGVACFPAHGRRRDELLASADGAMYASKRGGKNRTSIAGDATPPGLRPPRRDLNLELLHKKDPGTATHSVFVAILAVEIARALGLDETRLDDLRAAARLHDIGKLAVPDAILYKCTPLDANELRIIRTHSVVGAELLSSWGLAVPATIVLQHHERIDGLGYPAGLRGEQISIEGRIVHAAHAYVAMMRDRPYRTAMTQDEAFAELARHSGTQFDRGVVAALVALERSAASAGRGIAAAMRIESAAGQGDGGILEAKGRGLRGVTDEQQLGGGVIGDPSPQAIRSV